MKRRTAIERCAKWIDRNDRAAAVQLHRGGPCLLRKEVYFMDDKELVRLALEARERAYVPYSKFQVGAALLTEEGTIYQGCNIECAAYSPTNCAERTAFFKAISEGEHAFAAIAIAGGPAGAPVRHLCPPCGVCRQVMREFCDPETFRVLLASGPDHWETYLLKELLPLGFGPENLHSEKEGTHHAHV